MNNKDLTLIILAAGMGSRYGGTKQLDGFGPQGELILDYSIEDAQKAGFNHVVLIIRSDIKALFDEHFAKRPVKGIKVEYVLQDQFTEHTKEYEHLRQKPWGTGHAMMACETKVNNPFLIINADDYYGASTFSIMADALNNASSSSEFFSAGFKIKNTLSDHGAVSRGWCQVDGDSMLTSITEMKKVQRKNDVIIGLDGEEERALEDEDFVSMNCWGFSPIVFNASEKLFMDFLNEFGNEPKSEFLIPTIVDDMIKKGEATVKVVPVDEKWVGVTYPEDKPIVQEFFKSEKILS